MMSAPPAIRSMAIQSSPLCTLPLELRVEIALEVALLRTPQGPPSGIVPLLLSCKAIHHSLAFDRCAPLYARVYRCNFDTRAPRRRLSDDNLHVQNYAAQLKKCCIALKRLRQGDLDADSLEDDLWTAWLMALEDDGKNKKQLDWACLDDLLHRFVLTRLWDGREQCDNWPSESTINGLAVWLFWYRLSSDKLNALTNEHRSRILDLLRPYALTVPRYPPFHAPDCHFTLPMRPDRARLTDWQKVPTPHGFWPLYRTPEHSIHYVEHYGCPLEIAEPLLALGAQLLFFTLYWQPLIIRPDLPVDRAQALALGYTGVHETQADLLEYNAASPVKLVERTPADWDWYSGLTDEERKKEDAPRWTRGMRSPSAKWECDFNRLVGCVDPYKVRPITVTYTYGTLTGLWKGLHLSPNTDQYFAAVRAGRFPADFSAENPHLFMHPVYLQLREHHCISPARPSPCGGNPNDNDDGINHAWLPSSFEVREVNGIVHLRDLQRPSEPAAVYETYVEGKKNSHDPETCRHCSAKQRLNDAILAAKVKRNRRNASSDASHSRTSIPSSPSDHSGADGEIENARATVNAALGQDVDRLIDELMMEEPSSPSEDDEYEGDYKRETTCTGVQDIIVTGETLPHHGAAWHHFQCYGRIRPWDGLVGIVRVPVHPHAGLGVYIFRGYVIGGRNLVGSWRVRTYHTRAVPLEGPFVMSRVE